jgi:hypothetical protein
VELYLHRDNFTFTFTFPFPLRIVIVFDIPSLNSPMIEVRNFHTSGNMVVGSANRGPERKLHLVFIIIWVPAFLE